MKTHVAAGVAAAALSAALMALSAPLAAAEAPPSPWDPAGRRILSCDGETVTAYWAQGGALTSFLVVGSTDVIIPKLVKVTFAPDEDPVVTRRVNGFGVNAVDSVHCHYTDPQGWFIEFWGVRT